MVATRAATGFEGSDAGMFPASGVRVERRGMTLVMGISLGLGVGSAIDGEERNAPDEHDQIGGGHQPFARRELANGIADDADDLVAHFRRMVMRIYPVLTVATSQTTVQTDTNLTDTVTVSGP